MIARHLLRLGDGRRISAAEFGDPRGAPVLYFHGYPGSCLDAELGHSAARELGFRLIGVDRPGFGRSDPQAGRRLSDWPADVQGVADALGLERFAVAGASGGGPYAAACAALIPDRLTGVGILSGLGPPESRLPGDGMMWHNRLGLEIAGRAPWLVRPILGGLGPVMARFSRITIANLARHVPEPDRRILADPDFLRIFSSSFREAFRGGSAGAVSDALVYARPWDVDLRSIRIPVHLWHGEDDVVVPVTMARWVAREIPGARATYLPGEGHFSSIVSHVEALFAALRSSARADTA